MVGACTWHIYAEHTASAGEATLNDLKRFTANLISFLITVTTVLNGVRGALSVIANFAGTGAGMIPAFLPRIEEGDRFVYHMRSCARIAPSAHQNATLLFVEARVQHWRGRTLVTSHSFGSYRANAPSLSSGRSLGICNSCGGARINRPASIRRS